MMKHSIHQNMDDEGLGVPLGGWLPQIFTFKILVSNAMSDNL